METKILGFSGKLQSGKDSACNYLTAVALRNALKLTDVAYVNKDGKLVVEYTDDKGKFDQVLDVDSRNPELMVWLSENVWGYMKKFSCADALKEFCHYVLNLPAESVWGSNEEKNAPTHLNWSDMPTKIKGKTGPMSGREVLEYFGSQIVRKMYGDAWATALMNRIKMFSPEYALINDIRFPNEVKAVQAAGGKVIRLTRITDEAAKNTHVSNTALDDFEGFDYVLDNQDLSMEETHQLLTVKLIEWNFMELVSEDNK